MQPDTNDTNNTANLAPQPQFPQQPQAGTSDAQRDAVADITRGQLDQIYANGSPYAHVEAEAPKTAYERTHDEAAAHAYTAEHFQKYHSAWQDYYQKYYERYYVNAVSEAKAQISSTTPQNSMPQQAGAIFSGNTAPSQMTPAAAMDEIRSGLRKKIAERALKVKKSRHFWPLISAFVVAGIFLFLQYNQIMIANVAAYVSPGAVDPQNIIVDPSADTKVSSDPKVIIPKINVEAPVVYGLTTTDEAVVEDNLRNGVVHYPIPGANALPGEVGNTVILGHSSNDVFDPGKYKFVFVQLEKLVTGDTFYLNYNGTRYTYRVTKTETIQPNEINKLTAPTDKPIATLITCTPVGTALHRFIVTGEQVSPDPSKASASSDSTAASTSKTTTIAGNSPSFLERLFGAR